MDKKEIRKYISKKKKEMTFEQIEKYSDMLEESFLDCVEYKNADVVFAYIPFNQEVRTWKIIERAWEDGKRVAVPRIEGEEMVFCYIDPSSDFIKSSLGIDEPDSCCEIADCCPGKILMLMPGLAFDSRGARVGYGKGFYDKYLGKYREMDFKKVGLCYDFQMFDHIETDEHDKMCDIIISIGADDRVLTIICCNLFR